MAKYKTLTFAAVHMGVAFAVVGTLTGSWVLGGAVALIEPACNTLAYFLHELAWERKAQPMDKAPDAQRDPASHACSRPGKAPAALTTA